MPGQVFDGGRRHVVAEGVLWSAVVWSAEHGRPNLPNPQTMRRSIRLFVVVTVVLGILVGAVAGPVAADHSAGDDETDENERLMDVDLNDHIPGGEDSDNNTVDLIVVGY